MNDYWLFLLEGAQIESRHRFRARRGKARTGVPARVQHTIDRIRLENGLEPLYQTERKIA